MSLVDKIDALLPQTQCGECDYSGCRPYAEAIAAGKAAINKCPPGGLETLKVLGELLNVDATPFIEDVQAKTRAPSVAVIREAECIGCTKCIQACPVDAIVGSAKKMHSIIEHECTGCGLCVEPCPVDCIDEVELEQPAFDKEVAREHYQLREVRKLRETHEKQQAYREKKRLSAGSESQQEDKRAKNDFIMQAMQRVKAKKR